MEVITYEIPQKVRVRKYPVDCKKLCETLRMHKKLSGLSNMEIAKLLNVPTTKVEHWFRQDGSFSIPDEDLWGKIKELLFIKTTEFDKSILTFCEKDSVFEKGNRIYDSTGIIPTITCGEAGLTILERIGNLEVKVIGQMDNTIDHTFESANRVYDTKGIAPTVNTCGGGGLQPKILETVLVGGMGEKKSNGGTQYYQQDRVYSMEGVAMCHPSQIPDGSYKYMDNQYRIRKLTPFECWRLMDFADEDFYKAARVNSNTQLYKQAGNSIIVNVLVAILGQMILGKEDYYKEQE